MHLYQYQYTLWSDSYNFSKVYTVSHISKAGSEILLKNITLFYYVILANWHVKEVSTTKTSV